MLSSILCKIHTCVAFPQAELCVFKVVKLDVQIRRVFADPVTNDHDLFIHTDTQTYTVMLFNIATCL